MIDLLRSVRSKPPRLFAPKLISDVYPHCKNQDDLQDLLVSNYFTHVLWKFFHADVTETHLVLTLVVLAYEADQLGQNTCIDAMLADEAKLNALLLRSFQATLNHRQADSLECAVFSFFRVFANNPALSSHPFYTKWTTNLWNKYMFQIQEQRSPVALCFLGFCVSAVLFGTPLAKDISDRCVAVYFDGDLESAKVRAHANLLVLTLYDGLAFSAFQSKLLENGLFDSLPSCSKNRLPPSHDDLLSGVTDDMFWRIAKAVGHSFHTDDRQLAERALAYSILGPKTPLSSLADPLKLDASHIFDMFEPDPLAFVPDPTFPKFTPKTYQVLLYTTAKRSHKFLRKIYTHAQSVLLRITVVDPANNKITGTSKYLSTVEVSPDGTLEFGRKSFENNFKPGAPAVVLLLELQKPNKLSMEKRITTHGITACALQVAQLQDLSQLSGSSQRVIRLQNYAESTYEYNALIWVPQACLPLHVESLFWGGLLQGEQEEPAPKRRKTDSTFNNSGSVRPDLNIVLESVSTQKLTLAPQVCGADIITLTKAIFELCKLRGSTAVLVLPDKEAVDAFDIAYDSETVKLGSDQSYLNSAKVKILALLERASVLAAKVGARDIKNISDALQLYYMTIEPLWSRYLRELQQGKFEKYPFADFAEDTLEAQVALVLKHFAETRQLFSEIQSLQLVERRSQYTSTPHLIRHAKCAVVSVEDAKWCVDFKTAIVLDFEHVSLFENPEKAVVFGPIPKAVWSGPSVDVPTVDARSEIASLTSRKGLEIPGGVTLFKHVVQHVTVPPSSDTVNVAGAQFCVHMFQLMILSGIARTRILILWKSPLAKHLMEEILEEQHVAKSEWPLFQNLRSAVGVDYVVVSCEDLRDLDYMAAARAARLGLYFVGSQATPFRIFRGPLVLAANDTLIKTADELGEKVKNTLRLANA